MWYSYYGNGYTAQQWPESYRQNNANNVAYFFRQQGWTIIAISAMLGNMEAESYINPGQWEHGYSVEGDPNHGFGLVQWTPWTKYTNFATQNGINWRTNFDFQLTRIQYELEQGEGFQWITTSTYPLSFYQFATADENTYSVDWLAMCFFKNYERGVGGESTRQANARKWYEYLTGHPPTPPTPEPSTGKKFKLMFYLKPKWKRGIY